MKRELMYLPFLAALAFVGCSDDDVPANNGGGAGPNCGYVAVNIVSSAGTRAEFVDGSDTENQANEGLFFIFNGDGNGLFGNAQRLTFTSTDDATGSDNVEKIYSTLLVVDGETSDPTEGGKTYQIVCVLNAPAGLETGVQNLSDLTAKIANCKGTDADAEAYCKAGTFIMTNSVYKNAAGAAVVGAEVTQVYKSATEAYAAPVDIYVERVVAKVKVKVNQSAESDKTFNNGASVSLDGTEKQLKINPTGIALVSLADKSYLFKNLADYAADDWTWNAVDKFRSYWEVVPEISATAADGKLYFAANDKSYNSIVLEAAPATGTFDITNVDFAEYIQPNTVEVSTERPTALVVTAELQNEDGSALTEPLAYIRGGYTTSNKALQVVGKYLATTKGWWMKNADGTVVPFDESGLEWKNGVDLGNVATDANLKRYEVVAQVKENVKVYDAAGTEVTDGATTVNAHLKSKDAIGYQARVFTEGKCYYWVYINHTQTGTGTTKEDLPGVVRNHVYDLSVESISGVGVPIFDPEDPIIPEKVVDETTFYLGAKVNVLAWRVVATQHVNF